MKPRHPNRRLQRSVLLIAPKAPPYGGMALQAELLAQRMRGDGVRVAFAASNPPFPAPLHLLGRIPVIRTLLRFLTFCWNVWLLMAETEVVHVFACSWVYFFVVVWPAVIFGRLRRKRVVMNYRGGEADLFLQRYGPLAKPAFRLAGVLTAPSGFLANVLRAHTGVSVKIVPNIVDFTRFTYRERGKPAPKMVVTRHLEALYDTESILRAFREVQERYPEASLSIAGTGMQEASLRALAADLKLRNVDFLGLVPHAKLPALYDRCDILLNASKADNFPGSLVEAAAAGLVVISTGVGGIPYIFQNGESALLVDPGDWRAIAAGVLRVLTEPGLALRLTRQANQQCRQYDWEHVGPLLYTAYNFEPHSDSSSRAGKSAVAEANRDAHPGAAAALRQGSVD